MTGEPERDPVRDAAGNGRAEQAGEPGDERQEPPGTAGAAGPGGSGPPPAPERTLAEAVRHDILKSQQDASYLLRFLSERKDTRFAGLGPTTPADGSWTLQDLLRVLAMTPDQVKESPKDWSTLLVAVDHLATLASPATVESIQFTRSFVHGPPKDPIPAGGRDMSGIVRQMRVAYVTCGALGIGAVAFAVMLLFHVLSGQMILKGLEDVNQDQLEVHQLVAQAFPEGTNKPTGCPSAGWEGAVVKVRAEAAEVQAEPLSAMQRGLCDRLSDFARKMDLTYLQLGVWNNTSDRYYAVVNLLRPDVMDVMRAEAHLRHQASAGDRRTVDASAGPVAPPPQGGVAGMGVAVASVTGGMEDLVAMNLMNAWDRTELRTRAMLAGLTNYGIPSILGCIGAMVFVFRRLSAHLDDWTLDGRERFLILLRPLLGLMLGGLISLIFEATGATSGEAQFSLGFLAFVAGYAVQYIFDLLDGFVMRGSAAGRASPAGVPTDQAKPAGAAGQR